MDCLECMQRNRSFANYYDIVNLFVQLHISSDEQRVLWNIARRKTACNELKNMLAYLVGSGSGKRAGAKSSVKNKPVVSKAAVIE